MQTTSDKSEQNKPIATTQQICFRLFQISEAIPLVGEPDAILSLSSEYSSDDVYLAKVKDLASKYRLIRRTRPDGNCFFRAFSYATLERLLSDKEEFDKFYKLAENSKNVLVELGFQQFTVEDFYDTVGKCFGAGPKKNRVALF